jgi:hypothetical protein
MNLRCGPCAVSTREPHPWENHGKHQTSHAPDIRSLQPPGHRRRPRPDERRVQLAQGLRRRPGQRQSRNPCLLDPPMSRVRPPCRTHHCHRPRRWQDRSLRDRKRKRNCRNSAKLPSRISKNGRSTIYRKAALRMIWSDARHRLPLSAVIFASAAHYRETAGRAQVLTSAAEASGLLGTSITAWRNMPAVQKIREWIEINT